MKAQQVEKRVVAPLNIGEAAPQQPISGHSQLETTTAVHGFGRAAFVREEKIKSA